LRHGDPNVPLRHGDPKWTRFLLPQMGLQRKHL